ncbi:hypothetical protein [Wolbachia endosymbiont of Folsomia candida]|uniref:hypothetical protein n=1 Tax=Wolbachia endosymbiont of Folsomia candida TaxID=169402 RepID=UPI00139018FE|nr:hypothetical protein [Wolbachia endosymbiont of Folsomia candida]
MLFFLVIPVRDTGIQYFLPCHPSAFFLVIPALLFVIPVRDTGIHLIFIMDVVFDICSYGPFPII